MKNYVVLALVIRILNVLLRQDHFLGFYLLCLLVCILEGLGSDREPARHLEAAALRKPFSSKREANQSWHEGAPPLDAGLKVKTLLGLRLPLEHLLRGRAPVSGLVRVRDADVEDASLSYLPKSMDQDVTSSVAARGAAPDRRSLGRPWLGSPHIGTIKIIGSYEM